jgi:hypothetical protein
VQNTAIDVLQDLQRRAKAAASDIRVGQARSALGVVLVRQALGEVSIDIVHHMREALIEARREQDEAVCILKELPALLEQAVAGNHARNADTEAEAKRQHVQTYEAELAKLNALRLDTTRARHALHEPTNRLFGLAKKAGKVAAFRKWCKEWNVACP